MALMRHRLRRIVRDRSAVTLVEFGLALPVVMFMTLGGLELANLALAHLRVSQIAQSTADNAARILARVDEGDINELFAGVDTIGQAIAFTENGKIVLSSMEPNGRTGAQAGQKITWQRCHGDLAVNPAYGRQGAGASDATLAAGMGPDGRRITAAPSTAIMFVEVTYRYQPLISNILNIQDIRYETAFNVRERTDYAISNTQSVPVNTC